MEESFAAGMQPYTSDNNARLKDIEERQQLLKDRILLIGQNLIEDRESSTEIIQTLKKEVLKLKQENSKIKEFIQRLAEQTSELARKEELMILQRQFDILKPHIKRE